MYRRKIKYFSLIENAQTPIYEANNKIWENCEEYRELLNKTEKTNYKKKFKRQLNFYDASDLDPKFTLQIIAFKAVTKQIDKNWRWNAVLSKQISASKNNI